MKTRAGRNGPPPRSPMGEWVGTAPELGGGEGGEEVGDHEGEEGEDEHGGEVVDERGRRGRRGWGGCEGVSVPLGGGGVDPEAAPESVKQNGETYGME